MKRAIPGILITLSAINLSAQTDTAKKVLWGFNIGTHFSTLRIGNIRPSFYNGVTTTNAIGFRLGLLMEWKFSKYVFLAPKAELAFNDAKVRFIAPNGDVEYNVYPAVFEIAPHLNWQLNKRRTAPYILLGPNVKLPINDKQNFFSTNRSDLAIDVGIGLNKDNTKFIFAPELRYSYGLLNLSTVATVGRLNFHCLALVINFKG